MRRFLQISLLAVVAFSVIWLLVPRQSQTDTAASAVTAPAEYVAYYFHRTARCVTCLKIEHSAHDVIFRDFAEQLRDGKLLFLPTNVEATGNEHFVKDYELVSQALVLVKYDDGKPVQARDLDRIWDLVGDTARFDQYVHDEVSMFLGMTP
jgi:hypothetical protein